MTTFVITRKRIVVQTAQFQVDVNEGDVPLNVGELTDPESLDWWDDSYKYMSTDVHPVTEATEAATTE